MHQVCSSNHCEGEALHQEFACVACTDSVVLDGSRGGITMLQRGLDGSRRLFPGQAVDALASTSNSEFFAFACDQDVHLTACYHLQLTSSSGPAGFVIELSTKSVHIVTSRHCKIASPVVMMLITKVIMIPSTSSSPRLTVA